MRQIDRHRTFAKSRREIAERVRSLRTSRGWTQQELATRLDLSQNRLSEIERGNGSFTAEQFLLILRLFNVAVHEFTSDQRNVDLEIQNALARHGATQLQESAQVLPSVELESVHDSLREALLLGAPRLVTAAAPVIAIHADRIRLPQLYTELERFGYGRRLAWVVDNTLAGLNVLVEHGPHAATWKRLKRRAEVPLRLFLDFVGARIPTVAQTPPDLLDATIRSEKTLDEVRRTSSPASNRWGIVTSLQPDDFVNALRVSRAAD